MIEEVTIDAVSRGLNVAIYTNRVLLTEQQIQRLNEAGITHGVRAAGHKAKILRPVQVCSMMTEHSRAIKGQKRGLHSADIVIVDEAHQQSGPVARAIIATHMGGNCRMLLGFTATPVRLEGLYTHLHVAAKHSELRRFGALVPCETFAPSEIDMKLLKFARLKEAERASNQRQLNFGDDKAYNEDQWVYANAKVRATIHADVYKEFLKLNPGLTPTILFAPGVRESRWFTDYFNKNGVSAAHIDGEVVYAGGEAVQSTPQAREDLLERHRAGDICVICNRFVMREGIDLPYLQHGILACCFSGASAYLQAVGRLIRAYPGVHQVVLQDHGGNWHRFGSVNMDRDWEIGDTDQRLASRVLKRRRNGTEAEPIRCPKCGAIRRPTDRWFEACYKCGHKHKISERLVVQVDGSLKPMRGRIVDRKLEVSSEQRMWDQCYFRMRASRPTATLRQVASYYKKLTGKWPSRGLRNMPPKDSSLWMASISTFEGRRWKTNRKISSV